MRREEGREFVGPVGGDGHAVSLEELERTGDVQDLPAHIAAVRQKKAWQLGKSALTKLQALCTPHLQSMLLHSCFRLTDLAPAQMTATGVRASSVRSAEMSIVTSPPLPRLKVSCT